MPPVEWRFLLDTASVETDRDGEDVLESGCWSGSAALLLARGISSIRLVQ